MNIEFFLNSFLDKLEKKKINYCILRNYQSLPKKLESNDIDMLIDRKDLSLIIKTIQKYCNIILINQRDYLVGLTLHGITNSKKDYLKIDLITKIAWKGLSYLDNKTIFDQKLRYKKNIFIPQKHHEAIITFFSSYLVGGWINKRYQTDVRNQFIKNKKKIFDTFGLKFSETNIKLIYKGILNNNFKILIKNLGKLKRELIFHYIKKDSSNILLIIFKYYIQEIKMRYTDYAIFRLHVEYKDQFCKNKFSNLLNENIKVLFKNSLYYKEKNPMFNYSIGSYNPYRSPLLIIKESFEKKKKQNRLFRNLYKQDLTIKIKSQNHKKLIKYKKQILETLELKSKQRIINEFF